MRASRIVRRASTAACACAILASLAACSVSHDMRAMDGREPGAPAASPEPVPESGEFSCAARQAPVRWIGPRREADRGALAEWCAAVGPPEWRPMPARLAGPDDDFGALTVVTWNVHVGGGDITKFLAEALDYDCDGTGARVAGPFVLLIQEAFRASGTVPIAPEGARVADRIAEDPPTGPRLDIVEVAERCGLSLLYVPSMRNGREAGDLGRADRGSAILANVPLADPLAIELPLEAQRRVTVVATALLPGGGGPVRLASVHLDVAGSLLRVVGTGGTMRVRQGEGLNEALDLEDPERVVATVVGGDMNTWSASETVILRMLRAYPDSPDPGDGRTRGSWPADHIFFRAGSGAFELVGGSYVILDDAFGSDHRPRRVELRACSGISRSTSSPSR